MKKVTLIIFTVFCAQINSQSLVETVLDETPDSEINLYIVSQGFTDNSMQYFDDFVTGFRNLLWNTEPFLTHKSRFKVIKVNYQEANQLENSPHSPFQFENVSNINPYLCQDSNDPTIGPNDQYLQAECYSDFYDRMDILTPQFTDFDNKSYVLAVFNNNYYTGGGGRYTSVTRWCDDSYMHQVLLHEFGHTFGLLGDEYDENFDALQYDEDCVIIIDPNTNEPLEVGPGEFPLFHDRNLTDKTVLSEIPWKYLIDANTQIPTCTTAGGTCSSNEIGLFEGANYTDTDWYRSQRLCKMKGPLNHDFCQTCTDLINERILEHLCNTNDPITEDFIERHQYITHWRKSINDITSTSGVGEDISVQFVSEQSITLEDGFVASEGSDFKASIDDCDGVEIENNYRSNSFSDSRTLQRLKRKKKRSNDKLVTESKESIEEELFGVRLFPNPVKDRLQISADIEITQIVIFNDLGKEISNVVVHSKSIEIDVSKFHSGIYILKLYTEKLIKIAKIVKQ